jgi:O-antigen/teichoic acid export membrane protein
VLSGLRRQGIARHSVFNFVGLAIPLAIGLVLLPYITSGLGIVRFGILGLALAILEYSGLFSFGLAPASIKFVADALARRDSSLSEVVSISVLTQGLFGLVGGIVVSLAAEPLATRVFTIPAEVQSEAIASFRLLGAMVAATVVLWSLLGVLEGARRFGLMNALRIPTSAMTFVLPALGIAIGSDLPTILLMLALARVVACAVVAVLLPRAVPGFKWVWPSRWPLLKPLLAFGAWVSVSNLVNPLLVYGDRFILGSVVGLAAVGVYTAPFDALLRMHVIPTSLVRALFPVVSASHTLRGTSDLRPLFRRAVLTVLAMLVIPVTIVVLFAPDLLEMWLGSEFREAGNAARIIAVAMLVNCMAVVPFTYLAAVGRPDIPAKFHLAEVVIHIPLAWVLVSRYGLTGAATAFALRIAVDTVLLFVAANVQFRRGALPASR